MPKQRSHDRWILLPRHQRRIYIAARLVGLLDERGRYDDWAWHGLRRTRREALGKHDQDTIDDWTMDGLVAGRKEA